MPTLIIGLGGTGTEVVRRIRKRWRGGIPAGVALAVIDARSGPPQGGPIEDVDFTPVRAPVRMPYAFDEFDATVGTWWPKRMSPRDGIDFSDGCGAYRPVGRFFAFRYASIVTETIQHSIDRLIQRGFDNAGDQAQSFAVYLLGSLGNGTGGGTFLDVATIVKHQLGVMPGRIQVHGVFIPGSVTRHGPSSGTVGLHVAASGLAALLELQWEFNRHDPHAEVKPGTPYRFQGYEGQYVSEYTPARDQDDTYGALPIDYAHILDRRDRNGLQSDYPTLLNLAAEAITILVEGGDASDRLLDHYERVTGSRRFGSYGAARLSVPTRLLLQYAGNEHALATIQRATDPDPAPWSLLLADEAPDGTRMLRAEDATLGTSADFFLEHVLHIKETGGDAGGGASYNQLFDLFQAGDAVLEKGFDDIVAGVDELKDAAAIVSKSSQMVDYVEGRTKGLADRRKRVLLEGASSLWAKAPTDPERPLDAGVRWRIDRRVKQFVDAGAFGLLAAWLEELKRKLDVNRESVREYERRKWLQNEDHKHIDLARGHAAMQEQVDSILAWFRRGRLREDAQVLRQDGRAKFRFLVWESKIEAVERFYEMVHAHVAKLARAALQVAGWLNDPRMKDVLREAASRAKEQLEDNAGQRRTGQGLQAELFIGSDAATRERLRAALAASDTTSADAILASLAGRNRALFVSAVDTDAAAGFHDGPEPPTRAADTVVLIDDFRRDLRAHVEETIEPTLQSFCRVDAILETEARALLERYFDKVHLRRDALRQEDQKEVLDEIRETAHETIVDQIRRLPWDENKQEAMERGVDLLVAGRLSRVMAFATAHWSLRPSVRAREGLLSIAFLAHPEQATRVARAVETVRQLLGGGEQNEVLPHARQFGDPHRIDIVRVEIGADLDTMDTAEELPAYRRAMTADDAFSPHLTEQYLEMGERFLQDAGGAREDGGLLLALAELYGYVETDRVGNHKVVRAFDTRTDDGRVVYQGLAAETPIGPRGLREFIDFLEGRDDKAANLRKALKTLIFEELQREAYGHEGKPPVGWDGVRSRLSAYAGELRRRAAMGPNDPNKSVLERQAQHIDLLAAELDRLQGRGRPRAFE